MTTKREQRFIDAAKVGDYNAIRYLIEENINIDAQNQKGMTALINAARYGHIEIVRLLIENNALLELKCSETNNNALIFAVDKGHTTIVEALVEAGASPVEVCQNGKTPLSHAQEHKRGDIIEILQQALDEKYMTTRTSLSNEWVQDAENIVTYDRYNPNTRRGLTHIFDFAANMVITTVTNRGKDLQTPIINSFDDFEDENCFNKDLLQQAREYLQESNQPKPPTP
jgi:ankyrin repeat protein